MYCQILTLQRFLLTAAALACLTPVFAKVTVDNLLNYEVIQRTSEKHADIPLSGFKDFSSGSHIQARVSYQTTGEAVPGFDWKIVDTLIGQGWWKGVLERVPVGGEYEIQFRTNEPGTPDGEIFERFNHVLIGDVWGAAGQSNMLGMGIVEKFDNPIDQVHVITVNGPWRRASEPLGGVGCGPALRFAQRIFAATGIPIGLAYHAVGGTDMDFWQKGGDGYIGWTSVIDKAGRRLKGVIWYQGEANMVQGADKALNYKGMTHELIKEIRRYVGNATLPWVMAQIGTISDGNSDTYASVVREAQREISMEDPCAETITTIDLPRKDAYHFETPQYQIVGNRFAAAALHKAYGQKPDQTGPRFSSAFFADSGRKSIISTFISVSGGLTPASNPNGFFVLQNQDLQQPLSATVLNRNAVELRFAAPLSASATLCYGFGQNPQNLNLADSSAVPAQPFFNQPVSEAFDSSKQSRRNIETGRQDGNNTVELNFAENPFKLYALLSISFPRITSRTAALYVYSIGGVPLKNMKLVQGQDRCTISRRFLPPGCYVLRLKDGEKTGSKKFFWNFSGAR